MASAPAGAYRVPWRAAPPVGDRANLFVARSKPPAKQALRAPLRDRRGAHLRGYDPDHGPPTGPAVTPLRRSRRRSILPRPPASAGTSRPTGLVRQAAPAALALRR